MLNVLENASKFEVNKQRSLLLSRVAWRCGQKGESRKHLEHYFSYSDVDPRDIKALNFIATRNEMISELKEYLQQILQLDKDNERAIKFLQALPKAMHSSLLSSDPANLENAEMATLRPKARRKTYPFCFPMV